MKFSIVTPVYNMEKYISQTIESVLSQQGDFEIEYIIRDGGSTDNTVNIIKRLEKSLTDGTFKIGCNKIDLTIVSEKDFGMYDAINKGFSCANGDIFAWINADDYYLPKAFQTIAKSFEKYPKTQWIKGVTKLVDADEKTSPRDTCRVYHQDWIKKGVYNREAYFIEQDSVFWSRDLWQKIGGINPNLKNAGDYELWIKMAKFSPLQSLNYPVSVFRKLSNSLTKRNGTRYYDEQKMIRPKRSMTAWLVRIFFNIVYRTPTKIKPMFQPIYYFIYSIAFMTFKKEYYIEMNNGIPEKKVFKTYEV